MDVNEDDLRILPIASGLVTLAWYAMPDLIRSRGLRAVLKTGLLGVTGVGVTLLAQAHEDEISQIKQDVAEAEHGTAIAAAAIAATAAVALVGEKLIYRHGERRRRNGRRLAHTVPALFWAVAGALAFLPPKDHAASQAS